MAEILVTGGTGTLGRQVVSRLLANKHTVRVLSRRERPGVPDGVQVIRGDLTSGRGISPAVGGVDVIVHCASSPFRRTRLTDVEGTRKLVQRAKEVGSPHIVYISIVGVDRHPFPYYKAKFAAETIVEDSGLPWTILRATQFHDLLFLVLNSIASWPIVPVAKGFRFQPIDSGEVADRLAALVEAGPSQRVPDMGGPQVRESEELARVYLQMKGRVRTILSGGQVMEARGHRAAIVQLPLPGAAAKAFREGLHLCPERAVGKITWEEFLQRKLGRRE